MQNSMKTLNHIFWIFLFAVAISACSKDSEPCDPNDEESPCYAGVSGHGKFLLVEVKQNGANHAKYEYDQQNRTTVIYTYDPDGSLDLTTMYSYANGDFPKTVTAKSKSGDIVVEEYTFGNDGRPVSMVQTASGDGSTVAVDYQFSYSKNTMIETIIPREEDAIIIMNTYTYDDNGNLLSIVSTGDGQWVITVEQGNFDDKIAMGYYGNPMAWKYPGKNNHRTLKATDKMLGVTADYVYKYTYNAAGHPIKTEVYNKGSDVVVNTFTQRYIPAK